MPIYEYVCQACGHEFELLQRMEAPPPDTCPACQAPEVRKRISLTSFVLKGSGWYKDLYGLKSGGGDSQASHGGSPARSSGSAGEGASASAPSTPASSAPAASASAAPSAPAASSSSSKST